MTNRKIVLTDCEQCPKRDHLGAFTPIACVPVCLHVAVPAGLSLPYVVRTVGGRRQAVALPGIPDWCPLPADDDKVPA